MGKKEKLLKKYLDKKKNQQERDSLFEQINELSAKRNELPAKKDELRKRRNEGDGKRKNKKSDESANKRKSVNGKRDANRKKDADVSPNRKNRKEEIAENAETTDPEEHGKGIAHELIKTTEAESSFKGSSNIALNAGELEGASKATDENLEGAGKATDEKLEGAGKAMDEAPNRNTLPKDGPSDHDSKPLDPLLSGEAYTKLENINRTPEMEEKRRLLDIYYEKATIVEKIKYNLITMIQGSTGCGKTTQIPQFLLEAGFSEPMTTDRSNGGHGRGRLIGITQPRRLSAMSIASRINAELNEKWCGYKVKYESTVTAATKIKVMTEGVLLREIHEDFLLSKYSVIVLDEIHERSVNIDILIGLLSKIVQIRYGRRDPLRLCLMSATVDPEPFRRVLGEFEMISLQTKKFKVDILSELEAPRNYLEAILDKVRLILGNRHRQGEDGMAMDGGILVFLPTKQDIYQLKEMISGIHDPSLVLPLHSGLSKNEQNLVYREYDDTKIILATNIAETSITIDGLSFVIDSGLMKTRIKSERCTKYCISCISKSSAKQRAGRLGRVGPGVCFRMYTGEHYESLADQNLPQIYIEPLDSAVLQLRNLGIKNLAKFPFISPVQESIISEAEEYLKNLRAIDSGGAVTLLGSNMCRYPLSPRLSRLLFIKTSRNVFYELAVIASMLSIGFELRKTADTRAYFEGARSDMIVWLRVYYGYLTAKNPQKFCKGVGVSANNFVEVRKLADYLGVLSGRFDSSHAMAKMEGGTEDEIVSVLCGSFGDQLAVRSGNEHVYAGGKLCISKNSISVGSSDFVFENIICGSKEEYATGVTIVQSHPEQ